VIYTCYKLYLLGVSTREFCAIPLCIYACAYDFESKVQSGSAVWFGRALPGYPVTASLRTTCMRFWCNWGLAVWRHNKPKRPKKALMFGVKTTPQPRPCQSSVALLWVFQPPRTGFTIEIQVSPRSKDSIGCQNSKRIIFVFWKLVISRSYNFFLNSVTSYRI